MVSQSQLSLLAALVVILMGTPALASTINVPGDQQTIQSAIDAAADGDTVLVAPGTYTENINFLGKKIVVTSHFALDNDLSTIRSTIIDGSSPSNPDTASCVLMVSGEDLNSVLQGFTLTGGTGTTWVDEHGAGTYVEGGGILITLSSPTIAQNIIIGNEAIRKPGGATSSGGGGIRCGDGSPLIINNIITANAGMYGGGIVMNYASGIIRNNLITNNSVFKAGAPSYGGGGIWVYGSGSVTTIVNNIIVGNSSQGSGGGQAGRGGGMLIWSTPVDARNNIVWGNTQVTGGQVYVTGTTASFTYNDIEGGYNGEGNIEDDPLFASLGDFTLSGSSTCIDAGDTSAAYNDPEDPENPGFALPPSLGGLRNDMGAYGGPGRRDLGGVPTAIEPADPGMTAPKAFGLGQNYPNPFNPSTIIQYSLPSDSHVTFKIYSLRGREVRTLIDQDLPAGLHVVHWDGRDNEGRKVSSGLYLCRMQAGGATLSRKMIMMK